MWTNVALPTVAPGLAWPEISAGLAARHAPLDDRCACSSPDRAMVGPGGTYRVWFVMRDARAEEGPTLLHSRWAMSHLRGPMTRSELRGAIEARRAGRGARP